MILCVNTCLRLVHLVKRKFNTSGVGNITMISEIHTPPSIRHCKGCAVAYLRDNLRGEILLKDGRNKPWRWVNLSCSTRLSFVYPVSDKNKKMFIKYLKERGMITK